MFIQGPSICSIALDWDKTHLSSENAISPLQEIKMFVMTT
jgi:hypothetical protein